MTLHCKSIGLLPTLLMFALGGCTSSGTASLVVQHCKMMMLIMMR